MRVLAGGLTAVTALTLVGCSSAEDRTHGPGSGPSPSSTAQRSTSPDPAGTPSPTPPSPTASVRPDPVSLPALFDKAIRGGGLHIGRVTLQTGAYIQYAVTYRSSGLRISGLMNVPRGEGPWPAVVLAHGYIDPDVYRTGQGLTRERDYLARYGYLTLHVDYRNHAGSSRDPAADVRLRLGYTEDVINAVQALRSGPAYVDDDRIALLGRSMGGGVVYNVLTVAPGLVDAGVVFAPVSSDTVDNVERWILPDPSRDALARRIVARYGQPSSTSTFWRAVSPRTYFDRVTEPLLIHHGTSDDSCPIRWSRQTAAALEQAGKDVTLQVYPGEGHAFGPHWPLSMRRTVAFLDRRLA